MRPAAFLLLALAAMSPAQVTFDRLLAAASEPHNWLTSSGAYNGWRHSRLADITPANVARLGVEWVFQARSLGRFEATPLVVDGVMYITEPDNLVVALDAATGRAFWEYRRQNRPGVRSCCGNVNRGLAILGDALFMGTMDGALVALDAKTGRVLWETRIGDPTLGYSLTHAPLVVKDKVIVGPAGGELGIRGFLAAYDARTGKEVWRFNTVPGPGEPGHETWSGDSWKQGGGSIWNHGAYDPALNLLYWGIGNPSPAFNGDARPGDNFYTESVVAFDPDTGKRKWHYQFTPHDLWDWDAAQVPVLADLEWNGRARKLLLWANRNGFYYVLDRATGEFLQAKAFVKQSWNTGFDAKGRPSVAPGAVPTTEGVIVYPGQQGGTNWYSPSYSPITGLFYIPTWADYSSRFDKRLSVYKPGNMYTGGWPKSEVPASSAHMPINTRVAGGYGAVSALDARTGALRWQFKLDNVPEAGILTTASNLLFAGSRDGIFYALDARNGAPLWKMNLGANLWSGAVTFRTRGRQYVTVTAGASLYTFTLR